MCFPAIGVHANPNLVKITSADQLASFIDHTLLKPDCTEDQVIQLCQEARKFHFATVCVYPRFVKVAAAQLKNSKVRPIAVVGFPTGLESTASKVAEAQEAINDGAAEIDMVQNIEALKNKNFQLVERDISSVVQACGSVPVKVILETSKLTHEEKIIACALSVAAGADFVKTSTGFAGPATVEDVRLMREIVGPNFGVKASGGIRDYETAKAMMEAGANRLGTSNGVAIVQGSTAKSKDY
jgi:deoxyribose-phosphate aldolase